MTGWKHYVHAASYGQKKWYDWIGGFWLIFVAFNFAQIIMLMLLIIIMGITEPDLFNDFHQALGKGAEASGSAYEILFMLSAITATLFWILARALNNEKTRQIMGVIGLVMTIATSVFLYLQTANTNTDDLNSVIMSSIGANPTLYASFLLSFPMTLGLAYIIQKFWHARTIKSLHTAFERFNWKRVLFSMGVFWAVAASFSAIGHLSGHSPLRLQFDPARFFGFAFVSLLLIPLQSATEEIIVRGYMNQGLGQYIKNPWIIFTLTSLLFMALHLANPEASASADKGALMHILTMSSYFSFGFLLCILVYYEGGLETAIGVHAANNLFAAVFVNYEGSVLPTPSVYITQLNPAYDLPIGMAMLAIVTYILVRTRSARLKAQVAAPLARV